MIAGKTPESKLLFVLMFKTRVNLSLRANLSEGGFEMAAKKPDQSYERYFTDKPAQAKGDLGPIGQLTGKWEAKGTGWNMIALPFKDAPKSAAAPFRILMNQYDEVLEFAFVDDNVPNRGVAVDQRVATIDYQQQINQIAADDFPASGEAGPVGLAIHHEPGLWIWVKDNRTDGIDVARLASIPHGNAILALGESSEHEAMPDIPPMNALPFGRFEDLRTPGYDVDFDPYLKPYKHYIDNPFMGTVTGVSGFPGFNPADMTEILRFANKGVDIVKTTRLHVDSKREDAGIRNMPFTVREAEPVSMASTFWIQQVADKRYKSGYRLRLQYAQVVMLDFFRPREDQQPGRAQWPHISIATLDKVEGEGA